MRTSKKGIEFIAAQEGFVDHIYKDVAGVATIGYGHAIRPNESFTTLTKEAGLEILQSDLLSAENAINSYVKVPLNQNQFDALASFTFNLGNGSLASSTLLTLLNRGDYAAAADEFPKWCKAKVSGVLTVIEALARRRQLERSLFLTPLDPPKPMELPLQVIRPNSPTPEVPVKPTSEPEVKPEPKKGWWAWLAQLLNLLLRPFR